MPLTLKVNAESGEQHLVPSGSHIAVCDIVADIGVQPGSALYPAPKRQIFIRFQIPTERVQYEKDGKKIDGPATIGKTFTASMNEKSTLRRDLQNWRGRQFSDDEAEKFDVAGILGKGCMLSIVHNPKGDKVYSNIASVSGLPKGVKAPIPEIEPLYYASDDTRNYKSLPEWLQKKIAGQIISNPAATTRGDAWDGAEPTGNVLPDGSQITDDDIPF